LATSHLAIVRKKLDEYSGRGVIGAYGESTRNGRTTFRFNWLHDQCFTLIFDEKKSTLQFKDVFPHAAKGTVLHDTLTNAVARKTNKKLPAHDRIDPGRAEVTCSVRLGKISLTMQVKRNQYTYAVGKFVNLIHELFLVLNAKHIEYLFEHFDLPEE
jgi:hypothetical protein